MPDCYLKGWVVNDCTKQNNVRGCNQNEMTTELGKRNIKSKISFYIVVRIV